MAMAKSATDRHSPMRTNWGSSWPSAMVARETSATTSACHLAKVGDAVVERGVASDGAPRRWDASRRGRFAGRAGAATSSDAAGTDAGASSSKSSSASMSFRAFSMPEIVHEDERGASRNHRGHIASEEDRIRQYNCLSALFRNLQHLYEIGNDRKRS